MSAFGTDVLILMQMLVVCAVVLCGVDALVTDWQAKRLIRKRISDHPPRR